MRHHKPKQPKLTAKVYKETLYNSKGSRQCRADQSDVADDARLDPCGHHAWQLLVVAQRKSMEVEEVFGT